MATRQTNSRSSNGQRTTGKKTTSKSQGTKVSSQSRSKASKSNASMPRMTKEEIAEQSAFHDEIILVLTLVCSTLLVLANFGMGGFLGTAVNRFLLGVFGTIAYVVPFAVFIMVAFHISNRGNKKATRKIITGVMILFALIAFFQMLAKQYDLSIIECYGYGKENVLSGGIIGGMICKLLITLVGKGGTYVIIIAIFLIGFMLFSGKTILTALSKRSGQSIHDMREKYRENAALRQEYYQESSEDEVEQGNKAVKTKRKAKTFTLQSNVYEVDEETGEIKGEPLNMEAPIGQEENQPFANDRKGHRKGKAEKVPNEPRVSVDMAEIQPNLDHISITGSYVSSQEVPTYEEELKQKFGTSTYGGQAESIQSNLGAQVATMMNEDNPRQEKEVPKETVAASSETSALAEPVREAHVQVHEISRSKETEDTFASNDAKMLHNDYEPSGYEMAQEQQMSDVEMNEPMERTAAAHSSAGSHTSKHHAQLEGESVTTEDIANEIQQNVEKPYVFPPIDLLAKPKKNVKGMTEHDLKETATKLQKTLESFGVRAMITNVTCGPAVTRYEIQPETGVKVSTITKLADDIKLNLAATDIRIEAPIPGKAAVGIEVPNKENTAVMFRELIENKEFMEHPSDIAFAVGKDISGQSIITDIGKMPHLMIAGATGSGKSVCINTLIMSILYKASPKDVKLIMVDPKVVELSIYNGIPHLMIPVVTDPKKASAALNWAVVEMNERYKRFADVGVRDMKSYNAKIQQVEYLGDPKYKKMPQIVIIVDELADLMMVAKGEVEEAICRLAQMARAAGLHLVIATQRPSVNVITGLIKANVPSRIAFAVSSAIDSRTIIDGSGAEKLLGKGDMLFFPQGYPKPVRLQGAFISDKEVSAVVDFLSKENGSATYSSDVTEHINSGSSDESSVKGSNDLDDYFVQAGKFIIEKDKASIGMLQRVYKIGFNRAARIMDQLCDAGVVGPEEGTKPRKVIMSMEEFDQYVEEYV